MRIYMQKPAEDKNTPRFYHILIQKDLLGGWSLVREWGSQGASGRVKKTHYESRDDAEKAFMASRDSQLDKGFNVVFMEGTYI